MKMMVAVMVAKVAEGGDDDEEDSDDSDDTDKEGGVAGRGGRREGCGPSSCLWRRKRALTLRSSCTSVLLQSRSELCTWASESKRTESESDAK